jgi:hypothetical protein
MNPSTFQIAGNSSPIWERGFQSSLPGITPVVIEDLTADYTCRIAVLGTLIDREVTAKTGDNKYFRAWLTPEETATLSGVATVSIIIRNNVLVPALAIEYQIVLHVERGAWVP